MALVDEAQKLQKAVLAEPLLVCFLLELNHRTTTEEKLYTWCKTEHYIKFLWWIPNLGGHNSAQAVFHHVQDIIDC